MKAGILGWIGLMIASASRSRVQWFRRIGFLFCTLMLPEVYK